MIITLSSLDFTSSFYFLLIYIFIHLICSFLYLVSRQGFSVYPWLLWNFLCRPGCALPQRPSCLCSLVLGLKAFSTTARLGLYLNYHRGTSAAAVLVRLIMDKENHFDIFSTAPYQKKKLFSVFQWCYLFNDVSSIITTWNQISGCAVLSISTAIHPQRIRFNMSASAFQNSFIEFFSQFVLFSWL